MTSPNHVNQPNQEPMALFTRLLADYRARVYETHALAKERPMDLGDSSITIPDNAYTPTILVIEDNTDQWFLTRLALLQRFAKARIHRLTREDEVVPYLDSCRQKRMALPRMILVDLYLPSAQQGLNVFQTLKSHPIYKPVPTLALSSSTSAEDITQVFNHSADGYLIKPTRHQDWATGLSVLDKYWN